MVNYQDRILSPLERITELCNNIRSTEHNFSYTYTYEQANKIDNEVNNVALEIKSTYDEIVSLIEKVNIKDYGLLIQILRILSGYSPSDILDRKLSKITISDANHSHDFTYVLRYFTNYAGIDTKYHMYYNEQQDIAYQADIEKLNKKGSDICVYNKYFAEWYRNHIYDNNTNKWREKTDYEKSIYIKHPCDIPIKMHTLKIGMSFGSKQKIEIVDIFKRSNMRTDAQYDLFDQYENKDNVMWEDELIIIKHIGTMNDGEMQLLTIYDLKDFADIHMKSMQKYLRMRGLTATENLMVWQKVY